MRIAVAGVVGVVVLLALWPALCVESEFGQSSCTSAVLLPLPWGVEQADTWGMVVAAFAALLAVVLTLKLARRGTRSRDTE
jgi:hypothetical protein